MFLFTFKVDMIKILYAAGKEFSKNGLQGCYEKLDSIFLKETGLSNFYNMSRMNVAVDKWLQQFGGKLDWYTDSEKSDYVVFENDEDAVVFKLRFDIF